MSTNFTITAPSDNPTAAQLAHGARTVASCGLIINGSTASHRQGGCPANAKVLAPPGICELHSDGPALTCCLVRRAGSNGLKDVKGECVSKICCHSLLRWMLVFNSANSAISHSGIIFLRFINFHCLCCKQTSQTPE